MCKGGSTGKPKLQVPDVNVYPSTDDKVSTPKNSGNMQNISSGDAKGIPSTPKNSDNMHVTGADTNGIQQMLMELSGVDGIITIQMKMVTG